MQSARLRPLYSVSEYCFQLKTGAHAKFHPTVLVCSNSCRVPMAQKYPEKSKIFHRWHVSASTKRLTHSIQSQQIHHQPQEAQTSRMHQEGSHPVHLPFILGTDTMQHVWPTSTTPMPAYCHLSAIQECCHLSIRSNTVCSGCYCETLHLQTQSPGLYATSHRLIESKAFQTILCY